jgi:hypothetical protein
LRVILLDKVSKLGCECQLVVLNPFFKDLDLSLLENRLG